MKTAGQPAPDRWLDELFAVTAEEVADLSTKPEAVLSRLARRIGETTVALVLRRLRQQAFEVALRDSFYRDHPDLIGQEDVVAQVETAVQAEHPDVAVALLLPLVAQRTRTRLTKPLSGGGYL